MYYDILKFEEHEQLKEEIVSFFEHHKFKPKFASRTPSTVSNTRIAGELYDYFKNTSLLKWVDFNKYSVHMWLNRYEENDYQEPHNHADGSAKPIEWSFCYFVDVPDDPLFFFIDGDEQVYINEESGTFVLFDPFKLHGVDMNSTSKRRLTIAGNVVAKI